MGASSPAEFESRMNAAIARGGLSHVAFFHQSAQRAPARYAINATFCAFDTPGGPRWLFQDVHEGVDLVLPGMSGLELVRKLKSEEHTSRVPVIALTGRTLRLTNR